MIEIETKYRIYEITKGRSGNYYQKFISMILKDYGGATKEFFDVVGLSHNPEKGWKKKLGKSWKRGKLYNKTKKKIKGKGFYSSWEWKKARFNILKKYGSVCMLCDGKERIVVDHIMPRSKFPELELDEDNLQVLCNDCNMGKSNDDYTDFRPREPRLAVLMGERMED